MKKYVFLTSVIIVIIVLFSLLNKVVRADEEWSEYSGMEGGYPEDSGDSFANEFNAYQEPPVVYPDYTEYPSENAASSTWEPTYGNMEDWEGGFSDQWGSGTYDPTKTYTSPTYPNNAFSTEQPPNNGKNYGGPNDGNADELGGYGNYGEGSGSGDEYVNVYEDGIGITTRNGTYWPGSDGGYYRLDPNTGDIVDELSNPYGSSGASISGSEATPIGDISLVGSSDSGLVYQDASGNKYAMGSSGFAPLSSSATVSPLAWSGSDSAPSDVATKIMSGTVQTDSSGKINAYTTGDMSYKVNYNSSGQPYITNSSGQQVLLGQSQAGGAVFGVPASVVNAGGGSLSGILGQAANFAGNLIGLGNVASSGSKSGTYSSLGFSPSSGSAYSGYGYNPTSGVTGASYGTYGGVSGYSALTSAAGTYSTGSGSGWNPANYISTGLPTGTIYGIVASIVMWLLAIFGFIGIVGFVISGIMYLLAAGDEKSQEKAKRAMYYSITGVIVGLVGLVVIYAVNTLLRGGSYF